MQPVSLTLTDRQHAELHAHLFPGDGNEAVALLLCGRAVGTGRTRLMVRSVHPIPHALCQRAPDRVTWPTDALPDLLAQASKHGWSLFKIHGHAKFDRFSDVDDAADQALFPSCHSWAEGPHGSAVMLDCGRIFGRSVTADGDFAPLHHVNVVGDDLDYWPEANAGMPIPEHARRIAQSFGKGTYERLRRLRIAVGGCSGTGSVVIDQLSRNCVGEMVLVDPDRVEDKNLNRIVNSRRADADARRFKVDVLADAVEALGFGTSVERYPVSLFAPRALQAVASCDIVFGCMDSIDGRHLLNRLSTFYQLAYFDLGVKLEADGNGGVDQVCGTVHYLKPGGSSLLSRHVYTLEQVRAAGLFRTDPAAYRDMRERGYIKGVAEDRPAVIQLNSLIASLAVNELLARLHPYRLDPNGEYAIHRVSLSHGIYEHSDEGEPCSLLSRHTGRGDVIPLLDMPELSLREAA